MTDLIIPIKLGVAGFVAEIRGFAGEVEELILEAEAMAKKDHDECCGWDDDGHAWRDCPRHFDLVNLIASIRPVVDRAKAIDCGRDD